MSRKFIAANWKENPKSEKAALTLFRAVAKVNGGPVEVAVCPPFIYIERIAKLHRGRVALGAQDVFWEEQGPFTSEVGPKMLRSLGVRYVIVGHSERRKWMHETDQMVNKKIKLALADGLRVILCVGEPLAVRKRGLAAARRFVANQVRRDLAGVPNAKRNAKNIVIAYEPIWAIGTGRYDRPEDAREMAAFIKEHVRKAHRFSPRVLYGGSVNGRNIADYIQWREVDGALVGGASLKSVEFKKIINNTKHASIK